MIGGLIDCVGSLASSGISILVELVCGVRRIFKMRRRLRGSPCIFGIGCQAQKVLASPAIEAFKGVECWG